MAQPQQKRAIRNPLRIKPPLPGGRSGGEQETERWRPIPRSGELTRRSRGTTPPFRKGCSSWSTAPPARREDVIQAASDEKGRLLPSLQNTEIPKTLLKTDALATQVTEESSTLGSSDENYALTDEYYAQSVQIMAARRSTTTWSCCWTYRTLNYQALKASIDDPYLLKNLWDERFAAFFLRLDAQDLAQIFVEESVSFNEFRRGSGSS